MRRSELKRKTALKPGKPLARSSLPLPRGKPMKKNAPKAKLTPKQKRPLVERSGGWCELRINLDCTSAATEVAHRIGEGSGGRHGAAAEVNDRLSNTIHSCSACHRWCHDQPATARAWGWMLRNGSDPRTRPVYYQAREWVYLDDFGGWSVSPPVREEP